MFLHFALYVGVHAVVLWMVACELGPAVLEGDPLAICFCVLVLLAHLMFLAVQLRNVQHLRNAAWLCGRLPTCRLGARNSSIRQIGSSTDHQSKIMA